jgi:3',5'-cyclic AMP phosphodiesterase CpdA
MENHISFVHLTDLHIGDPATPDDHLYSDTSAALARVLAEVARLRPAPAFIVASGDLTNRGDVASYRELTRIFAEAGLDMPELWALGNHDTRPGFYQGVLGRTDEPDAPYCHDRVIAGLHVITLDSSAPHQVGGSIEPAQFAWLEAALARHPELPKLIVSHHPPLLDEDNLTLEWEAIAAADTVRLRDMLAGYDVVGILSGHIHFDRVSLWHGIPVVVGTGQHAATDVTWLTEGIRMLAGVSFAIGTLRPSGLTVSFVPVLPERRPLHSFTWAEMAEILRRYEARRIAAAAQ